MDDGTDRELELFTVSEAAPKLGVHRATLRWWIKLGAIAIKRVGPYGTIRIPKSEIDRALRDGLPKS